MSGIYFLHDTADVDWSTLASEDFSFSVNAFYGSLKLGRIDGIRVLPRQRAVVLIHFAIWKQRRGLRIAGVRAGEAMAYTFRDCVRTHYNARKIVFQENHSEYWEMPYEKLFRRLGAEPRRGQHPHRPAWHWIWEGRQDDVGEEWLGRNPSMKESGLPGDFGKDEVIS